MVVGLRGTLGLGVALALAVMLWRLVERTVAAVGAGRPAQADELLIGLTASLALACVLWLALGLVLGLKALSPAEMKRITGLNAAYLERHGFPFIVCVGNHTKQSLFLEFDRRLDNSRESEMREALGQVADIALLRLNSLFSA